MSDMAEKISASIANCKKLHEAVTFSYEHTLDGLSDLCSVLVILRLVVSQGTHN